MIAMKRIEDFTYEKVEEKEKKVSFKNLSHLIDLAFENMEIIELDKEQIKTINDLDRYISINCSHSYFMNYSYSEHNLINNTYGKKSVTTIRQCGDLFTNILYCTNCGKTHSNIEYSGEVTFNSNPMKKTFITDIITYTCKECNTEYSKDQIKFIDSTPEYMYGNVFVDEDKISISCKTMYNFINRHGHIYYEDGYTRLTLNTKTGYSYTTNKGHAYKELQRIWDRYNKVLPVMFNSTYCEYDNTDNLIHQLIESNFIESLKEMSKKDLIQLFSYENVNEKINLKSKIRKQILNDLIDNVYSKVQSNFNYKVSDMVKNINIDYNYGITKTLKMFNRYVNLDSTSDTLRVFTDKFYQLKSNKIGREEVNPINALFKAEKVTIGKKTRALVQQHLYNRSLIDYLPILLQLKNPSNINKLINYIIKNPEIDFGYEYYIMDIVATIKIWSNFRDENYIVSQLEKEMNIIADKQKENRESFRRSSKHVKKTTRLQHMKDSYYIIRNIERDMKDLDINTITEFKNEKQFHDDLSKFINSDTYKTLIENKRASIVFDLEDEVLAFEDKENNIIVAKTSAELMNIGRQMSICVGGYTDLVLNNRCKIVYIMDEINEKYKACLEIRPIKISSKKYDYELVQAKLKYNARACEDATIYNKIKTWANSNNIKIKTYDMELPKSKDLMHAI